MPEKSLGIAAGHDCRRQGSIGPSFGSVFQTGFERISMTRLPVGDSFGCGFQA
jgi:hypothetical protein